MAAAELVSHFGNTSIDSPVLETVTTRAFNNLPEAATGSPAVAHSEEITGETSPDTSSEECFATAPSCTTATVTSPMSLARNSVPEVSDEVVLITSDSLTLTASRALLIKHSPFFAGLLSLPSPEPNAIPLDLPSATSAGLGLILGILACVRPDESTGSTSISPMAYKYWMAIKEADLYIFGEAALCADAYDFPIFERLFVRHIIARLDHDPMLKFTFCAITGQTGNLKSLASETMTGTNRLEIPHTMSEVLQRFAPDVRARLMELYRRIPVRSSRSAA